VIFFESANVGNALLLGPMEEATPPFATVAYADITTRELLIDGKQFVVIRATYLVLSIKMSFGIILHFSVVEVHVYTVGQCW
jgi:hypothetical protein